MSGRPPRCPVCRGADLDRFYRVAGVPTNSVRLLASRDAARGVPRGDIELAHCRACDHVFNAAFDPALAVYDAGYESTQAFSPTFNDFHRGLAERLVERFDLRGGHVVEIGCGEGEFLAHLCRLGGNRGTGFDPAHTGRLDLEGVDVRVVREPYGGAHEPADLVCCKMTLEHVAEPADLLAIVKDRRAGLFLQVPDAARILREAAYWDIYYEHCGYFSWRSLARLCRDAGFAPADVWTDYGGQYLMLAADRGGTDDDSDAGEGLGPTIDRFRRRVAETRRAMGERIRRRYAAGQRIVLWGGGSKAVALITTLGLDDEIAGVVDINPRKQGSFIAGGGQPIVAPAALTALRPDLVVVMNPLYRGEIARDLAGLGCQPDILVLGEDEARPA